MDAPDGLSKAGSSLWVSLDGALDLSGPMGRVALEACRCADRLDELNDVIQGKGVLNLLQFRVLGGHHDEESDKHLTVSLKFDAPLAEARQQQIALKTLLTALGVDKAPAAKSGRVSSLDQLASRRAARKPRAASQ